MGNKPMCPSTATVQYIPPSPIEPHPDDDFLLMGIDKARQWLSDNYILPREDALDGLLTRRTISSKLCDSCKIDSDVSLKSNSDMCDSCNVSDSEDGSILSGCISECSIAIKASYENSRTRLQDSITIEIIDVHWMQSVSSHMFSM